MARRGTLDWVFEVADGVPPKQLSLDDAINLEQAQDLCWQAMETPSQAERIRLAVAAATLTRFCSDAFALLANDACANDAERLLLLNWAVRVGEIVSSERIADHGGHLRGWVDARPYIRARSALANTLRRVGCVEEGLRHYEDLLRMEHGDYVARTVLITGYLELGRLDLAKTLIDDTEGFGGTYLHYNRLVWCWLARVSPKELGSAVSEALSSNLWVPRLLKDPETVVERSPFGVSSGGADEADDYLQVSYRLWRDNPKLRTRLLRSATRLTPIIEAKKEAERQEFRRRAGLSDDPPRSA